MNDGLKQRLIGALVLVGIAVIFLPGFFKEHTPYQVDSRSQIPPRPDVEPVVIEKPQPPADAEPAPDPQTMFLPDESDPVASRTSSASSAASVAAASIATEAEPASAAGQEPRPASVASESSASSASSLALPDAWVVQVASLSKPESAQRLRQQLQERGYKAYVRLATTGQGEVSRVFIGPKLDKQAALDIKETVDPEFKVDSLVLRFKP